MIFVHPLRASHASPSLCEEEGACLIGLPVCWQIYVLVGSGVASSLGRLERLIPLHPHSDPTPMKGSVHNVRHSGESRNPEGPGNGDAP